MESLSPQEFFDLESFRHAAIFQNCFYVWEALKKIESYIRALPLGDIEVGIPAGAHLIHPELISIGKGSVVEPGAYIRGPCWIGEYCTIRQGAYIRGDALVGDHCVIGHDTEIKNSMLLNHAKAAHFAYLGDSILGNHVNLGAGFKCANVRFDHGEVVIRFQGKKILTGMKKFGAIFGDETQVGCNGVSNPGTITGKGVVSYPCINFGGVISAQILLKHSQSR